jgi:hypothetical protein
VAINQLSRLPVSLVRGYADAASSSFVSFDRISQRAIQTLRHGGRSLTNLRFTVQWLYASVVAYQHIGYEDTRMRLLLLSFSCTLLVTEESRRVHIIEQVRYARVAPVSRGVWLRRPEFDDRSLLINFPRAGLDVR